MTFDAGSLRRVAGAATLGLMLIVGSAPAVAHVPARGVAAPLTAHMAAYNAHKAGELAASFAPDATLYIGNGAPAVSGREAIEKFYADFFAKNRVTSRVITRSVYGNYVIDTERLRFNGRDLCCIGSVYEMKGPLIQSLRFYMSDDVLRALTAS